MYSSLSVILLNRRVLSSKVKLLCSLNVRNMSSTTVRPKVFVTRRVPEDGINLLRKYCEVTQWNSDEAIPRTELIKGIKDVDALFCLLTDRIDSEILQSAGLQRCYCILSLTI